MSESKNNGPTKAIPAWGFIIVTIIVFLAGMWAAFYKVSSISNIAKQNEIRSESLKSELNASEKRNLQSVINSLTNEIVGLRREVSKQNEEIICLKQMVEELKADLKEERSRADKIFLELLEVA